MGLVRRDHQFSTIINFREALFQMTDLSAACSSCWQLQWLNLHPCKITFISKLFAGRTLLWSKLSGSSILQNVLNMLQCCVLFFFRKQTGRKFREGNYAWQWGKPPSWVSDRQRKYSSLSKQTCLHVIRGCSKFCKNILVLPLLLECGTMLTAMQIFCDRPPSAADKRFQCGPHVDNPTCAFCHSSTLWGIPVSGT